MTWLLDTCVLSEWTRAKAEPTVIAWLDEQPESSLFIGQLSLAELERGIFKIQVSNPIRAAGLRQWAESLELRFIERVLPLDRATLRIWADLSAQADLAGKRMATADSLLMATAQRHGLTVVTRNVSDFARYPRVFNPWPVQAALEWVGDGSVDRG